MVGRAESCANCATSTPTRFKGPWRTWNASGCIDRHGARFKASDGLRYIDDTLDLIAI